MNKESVAVILVSNGPGELSTWVKPVIKALKSIIKGLPSNHNFEYILKLILVPCPNATGNEFKVAKEWGEFDFVSSSKDFWKLVLSPKRFSNWPKRGLVVFLGGDQFWSVLLAKRLGYINITYAEWVARWPQWNYSIAVMNKKVKNKLPYQFRKKCHIIGDLMADIQENIEQPSEMQDKKWIALLPGSKKAKLCVGIPFFLEVADLIMKKNPNINLVIPMAPTTNIQEYLYFQSDKNPIAKSYLSKIKSVNKNKNSIFDYVLETNNNTKINVIKKHPNYEILSNCDLAITTVGANTAELAAINLPMIVILPTQHLEVMNAWDGIIGILTKVPLINKIQNLIIRYWFFKRKKYFAWPNIKAKRLIVPERIGRISPKDIAIEALHTINDNDYLQTQKQNLSTQRGQKGASEKLANMIIESLKTKN